MTYHPNPSDFLKYEEFFIFFFTSVGFQHLLLQGFNRIAAIALLFMNEEDAFWCLVYIVEQLMPPQYYSKQLVGAQVDQVLKEAVFPVA